MCKYSDQYSHSAHFQKKCTELCRECYAILGSIWEFAECRACETRTKMPGGLTCDLYLQICLKNWSGGLHLPDLLLRTEDRGDLSVFPCVRKQHVIRKGYKWLAKFRYGLWQNLSTRSSETPRPSTFLLPTCSQHT